MDLKKFLQSRGLISKSGEDLEIIVGEKRTSLVELLNSWGNIVSFSIETYTEACYWVSFTRQETDESEPTLHDLVCTGVHPVELIVSMNSSAKIKYALLNFQRITTAEYVKLSAIYNETTELENGVPTATTKEVFKKPKKIKTKSDEKINS